MLSQISIKISPEHNNVDQTVMIQSGSSQPLGRDSEISSLKSYSASIGNTFPISEEKNIRMGAQHRPSSPYHSSHSTSLPHVNKKKSAGKDPNMFDIHQRAKALAKETERRRRAALDKKIRMQREERHQRERIFRERRERARYGMKMKPNTNEHPTSVGDTIELSGPSSDSVGHRIMLHSTGNGSESSDSFDGISRPQTAATLTSQSFNVFNSTREVKSAQTFANPSEKDVEEDDDQMDQIAMKSPRGDSPPLGALDRDSFSSRCGSPSAKSIISRTYQYLDLSHDSPRKMSSFPVDLGMSNSTQTRPSSRASHSSAGSRKNIVGKVEVVFRNDRRMRLVKGAYVEVAGDAQTHIGNDLDASDPFNRSINFATLPNRRKELMGSVPISQEKNANSEQSTNRNVSARCEGSHPGSVRFSRNVDNFHIPSNKSSSSDWDFSTFSISGEDATSHSIIQRPYSAVTNRVRIHKEAEGLYSGERQRRRPNSAYSYEPIHTPHLKLPIPKSSKPSEISRTVAVPKKDPVRSEQYSKIPVACRTTAFPNATSPMRPTRADLLLARVESMLRREGSRRTEPSTFFPHPPLSRYASAPSFLMKNAVDALPGDEMRIVLGSRLERARNKSMPRRWVDKRTTSRNDIIAQIQQTGTGSGIELPPIFPTRLPRWRSAPGQGTGFPENDLETGRTVAFSPFHTGFTERRVGNRRHENMEGELKKSPLQSFGEIDESLRVFLLTEHLCQYEELSVNQIMQAVDIHSQQQIHAPTHSAESAKHPHLPHPPAQSRNGSSTTRRRGIHAQDMKTPNA